MKRYVYRDGNEEKISIFLQPIAKRRFSEIPRHFSLKYVKSIITVYVQNTRV